MSDPNETTAPAEELDTATEVTAETATDTITEAAGEPASESDPTES